MDGSPLPSSLFLFPFLPSFLLSFLQAGALEANYSTSLWEACVAPLERGPFWSSKWRGATARGAVANEDLIWDLCKRNWLPVVLAVVCFHGSCGSVTNRNLRFVFCILLASNLVARASNLAANGLHPTSASNLESLAAVSLVSHETTVMASNLLR